MKKIVLIALLAVAAAVVALSHNNAKAVEPIDPYALEVLSLEAETDMTQQSKVFICTGGSSKRYHSTAKCSGLRNCGGSIKELTQEGAEKMGRTPCKICCY